VSFREAASERTTHLAQEIAEGLRYVWQQPILRSLALLIALLNFIEITSEAQLVLLAKDRLHASDVQVALFLTAGSVGVVVFSLPAGPLRRWVPWRLATLGALMMEGALTGCVALVPWYGVAVGCGRYGWELAYSLTSTP